MEESMRSLATCSATVFATALGAAVYPAAAEEIIIRTPPGAEVTVVHPRPVPPPGVVVRPYAAYDSPGVYTTFGAHSCSWLYRRASETDDPYWWSRYHDCAD
jgi:hypothetical protein